ncbi:DKK3 protein, partial [Polyodon spathula]|nr:DKK3 protein [Polyodon spathula]
MLPLVAVLICLSGEAKAFPTDPDAEFYVTGTLAESLTQGESTLNDMFREVEELMEDTQHKREEALHQMVNESIQESELNVDECIVNEDCGNGNYCQTGLPCKMQNLNCTKDEECCEAHMCVWGQCMKNSIKGGPGTICEYQNDCNRELCCAFYKALLFPVCTALPKEGEHCHDPSNPLLDLLSWDQEPEGPCEYCSCSNGLSCQTHG